MGGWTLNQCVGQRLQNENKLGGWILPVCTLMIYNIDILFGFDEKKAMIGKLNLLKKIITFVIFTY